MPRYFCARRARAGDPNSFTRRPHVVWWLRVPIYRVDPEKPSADDAKRAQRENWAEAIRQTLIMKLRELGLHVDPKRPALGKNPHHDHWDTKQGAHRDWTLGELTDALGGSKSLIKKSKWKTREIDAQERFLKVIEKKKLSGSTADVVRLRDISEAQGMVRSYKRRCGNDSRYFNAEHASQGRNCFIFEKISPTSEWFCYKIFFF